MSYMADTGSPNSATCANSPPGPERLRHSGLAKSGPPVDELSMCPTFSPRNLRDLGALPTAGAVVCVAACCSAVRGQAASTNRIRCRPAFGRERATVPHRGTGNRCWVLELDMNTDLRARRAEEGEALCTNPSADCAFAAMVDNYRLMPRFPAPLAGDGRRRAG